MTNFPFRQRGNFDGCPLECAYLIFAGRALIEMALRQPRAEAEFATISGVGAVKLERFAEPFLAAINAASNDIVPD